MRKVFSRQNRIIQHKRGKNKDPDFHAKPHDPTLRQFVLSAWRLRLLIQTNCLSYINECVGYNLSNHAASRKKSGCFYTRILCRACLRSYFQNFLELVPEAEMEPAPVLPDAVVQLHRPNRRRETDACPVTHFNLRQVEPLLVPFIPGVTRVYETQHR